MGIVVDIAIGAIFAIALIVGVVKGFLKQLSGILRGIVALVGSIVLTALIINLLQPTGIYNSFAAITTSWFGGDLVNIHVHSSTELALVLAEHGALRILTGLSGVIFDEMGAITQATGTPCNTLAGVFGHYVANLIIGFVVWLILFLLLRLLFKGIIKLLQNIIVMPAFKTIDRVLGGIWALALTYVITIGLLLGATETVIIKFFPDVWDSMRDFIQNTTLLLWLHDTNIIGQLIAGLFNVTIESIQI